MQLEPLKFTGFKIVGQQKMKQSGCKRITIELTESDSKIYAGSLGIAEAHDLTFNGEWTPLEIEGEQNSDTERVKTLVGRESIYVRFKRLCEEYSGEGFYNQFKDKMGIKHLKDLEKLMPIEAVESLLKKEIQAIYDKMSN